MILALDVGTTETGWVIFDKEGHPEHMGIDGNEVLFYNMQNWMRDWVTDLVIERLDPRGMPIGESTLTTVLWAGRYDGLGRTLKWEVHQVRRRHVKSHLCGTQKAKDSNIIQALIDKFASSTPNKGKGTKNNPGWFFGFKSHIWQAYAAGITYLELADQEGNYKW